MFSHQCSVIAKSPLPKDATPTPCQRQKTLTPETPFFGVVAVLRGPLFVNTCGHAIGSCAQDFALILCFEGWGRAGMTRGTKVEWECETDFLWWKNAVFLGWWGA